MSARKSGERHHKWTGDQASYRAIHDWMAKHYPKTGVCYSCFDLARTEYALKHGRRYSRDRKDYLELCHECHMQYDFGKLSESDVDIVIARIAMGATKSALAREFGVSRKTIYRALART
jgi:hypothetical protein